MWLLIGAYECKRGSWLRPSKVCQKKIYTEYYWEALFGDGISIAVEWNELVLNTVMKISFTKHPQLVWFDENLVEILKTVGDFWNQQDKQIAKLSLVYNFNYKICCRKRPKHLATNQIACTVYPKST